MNHLRILSFLAALAFMTTACLQDLDMTDKKYDSCFDLIQNNGETGVDCGGRCGDCSSGQNGNNNCAPLTNSVDMDSTPPLALSNFSNTVNANGHYEVYAMDPNGDGEIWIEFGTQNPPQQADSLSVVNSDAASLQANEIQMRIYFPNIPGGPTYTSSPNDADVSLNGNDVTVLFCGQGFSVIGGGAPDRMGNIEIEFVQ